MAKSFTEQWEKESARFEHKGALVDTLEHAVFDKEGRLVKEGKFDIMEREFRCYNLTGMSEGFATDPHAESCAQLRGSEQEFFEKAREARDQRLVGMKNGSVARAVGGLADGTGYLVDQHGRPINRNVQQAPITPMRRKAEDW